MAVYTTQLDKIEMTNQFFSTNRSLMMIYHWFNNAE